MSNEVHSSAIQKLPNEILRFVFDNACDTNHFKVCDRLESRFARTGIHDKPALVLSSVCLRWRNNSLSIPSIWSRISLQWKKEASGLDYAACEKTHRRLLSALALFLQRSLQCPLALTVVVLERDATPFIPAPGLQHPVAVRLIEHANRWGSFTYHSHLGDVSDMFQAKSLPGGFPLLRELKIIRASERDISFFSCSPAPKLKSLKLPGLFRSITRDFPFAGLSHLEVTNTKDTQTLFEDSPNLTSLTLTLHHGLPKGGFALPTFPVFPSIALPSLKTVYLERSSRYQHSPENGSWANLEPFMDFLSRSSCCLTTLSIHSLSLSDYELVQLLASIPTLLNLSVDDSGILLAESPLTWKFIDSLHAIPTSPLLEQTVPIVPRLHSLTLDVGAQSFKDASVVEMVQSRWIPDKRSGIRDSGESLTLEVDCLRVFTVRFRNREEPTVAYQPLDDIERLGMRLVVLWRQ
ncbi:hypothetical protein BT96DRAFT_1017025 [Gymnopus androsaceus JB14]|uniref:F-box domain-containing protein n=1 Tax=Gymnopus androsaceus JB14 TaxID=1447944 RepID=A0A6A4HVL9_9AGAR|nr:hypothetical protein BT96DRAFT_1017025 [Gymnopus androsaceus JB14]